jgi:hypothetical protein
MMSSAENLVEAVKRAVVERDGRLTLRCGEAFGLAEKHGVAPAEIGRVCNEQHIKIVGCQLGCFK